MLDIFRIFSLIGQFTISLFTVIGRLGIFTYSSVLKIFLPPIYLKNILQQMFNVGYLSLPVVGLTTLFTGMALALQIYEGASRFNAESTVAFVVAIGMVRELSPVLGGLMVAGRVGAAMAAEIGTMRVTEQIDALYTLSTDPFKYLMAPRLIAGITMLPLLVLIGDIIGISGGFFISTSLLDLNQTTYIKNTIDFLQSIDVISGLVKAAFFGFIVTLMGCYNGFYSKGGAQGVGSAATNAVVSGSILILSANLIITRIFFGA
mgnify:CR=1 FL=1